MVGPAANAHGPNEFLHLPYAKKLSACVSSVLADHAKVPGTPLQYRRRLGCILLKTAAIIEHCGVDRLAGGLRGRPVDEAAEEGCELCGGLLLSRRRRRRNGVAVVVAVVCGVVVLRCVMI